MQTSLVWPGVPFAPGSPLMPGAARPRPTPPNLDAILKLAAELEQTAAELEHGLTATLARVREMHWVSPTAMAARATANTAADQLRGTWQTYRKASAALREHATRCQAVYDTDLAQWIRDQQCLPGGGAR